MLYLKSKVLSDTKVRKFGESGLSDPVRKEAAVRFLFMRPLFGKKIWFSLLFLGIVLLFFENEHAQAAFDLSATPYEGGFDLRFGRISPQTPQVKKELTIRITTDVNKKYRVYQEMLTPLTRSEGQTIPDENLTFYTLLGSNTTGSLDAQQEQPLRWGRRLLLYTSNSQGEGDSFMLVYGLRLPEGLPAGTYRGRMMFSLEATDGSETPQKVYLNVVATLAPQATWEVITPLGGRTIELQAGKLPQKNEVLFRIRGSLGETYRIIQSLPEPLRVEERTLSPESVLLKVSEGRKGVVAGTGPLRRGETVLYTSSPRGEPDTILVSYNLAPEQKIKAGTYRGRISFRIETAATLAREKTSLNFLVKIEPVFELKITPETGGRIQFKNLKAGAPPQINEVLVEVDTNLGKPYQVNQKVHSLLTNRAGQTIPEENFLFYTQRITEAGVLKQTARTPVEVGETTLYISDGEGRPASFKIIYELTIPRDLRAGDYSSRITYSIAEL